MAIVLFTNLTSKERKNTIDKLISGSTPSQDYFLMITLAILTATFGILLNDIAVIIGSMLIAPMLYPILAIALGITLNDFKLISRSFYTIIKSLTFGILASAAATLLFSSQYNISLNTLISSFDSSLTTLVVALVAGLAATFAYAKPQLNEILPGVAISVTLIPPIAGVGIGLAKFNPQLVANSLLLFIVNTAGIIFISTITFSLMAFQKENKIAQEDIKKEDIKLQKNK